MNARDIYPDTNDHLTLARFDRRRPDGKSVKVTVIKVGQVGDRNPEDAPVRLVLHLSDGWGCVHLSDEAAEHCIEEWGESTEGWLGYRVELMLVREHSFDPSVPDRRLLSVGVGRFHFALRSG
jgi:hypothetical protein